MPEPKIAVAASDETYNARIAACALCPNYNATTFACGVDNRLVRPKARFMDTHCPDTPSKWPE